MTSKLRTIPSLTNWSTMHCDRTQRAYSSPLPTALDCLVAKAIQSKVPLSSFYVTSISNMPLYRPRQLSFHELHPSIVIPAPNSLQSFAINFVPRPAQPSV